MRRPLHWIERGGVPVPVHHQDPLAEDYGWAEWWVNADRQVARTRLDAPGARQREPVHPHDIRWCLRALLRGARAAGARLARLIHGRETNEIAVSTVFLGIDHNWTGQGEPLLYETVVVGGDWDRHRVRYSDRWSAYLGHQKIVAEIRAQIAEVQAFRVQLDQPDSAGVKG